MFSQIAPKEQRFEILDWYHLVEHLHGVGGSIRRLENAEQFLWNGDVESAMALFDGCKFKRAVNFVSYLRKHCLRIPEYSYFHHLGLTIASGAVESSIKQIGGDALRFLALNGIKQMSLKFCSIAVLISIACLILLNISAQRLTEMLPIASFSRG